MQSFLVELWEETAQEKYCTNSANITNVKNLGECQAACEADMRCTGISYNHTDGGTWVLRPERYDYIYTDNCTQCCHVCNDDTLTSVPYNMYFYKKPSELYNS